MQSREKINITETVLSIIPEIARSCGIDETEISGLQAEYGQYNDTNVLLYLLNLLSFTENGYLTTPALHSEIPELADEINFAKINLDALIKSHLLLQSAEISAGLARVESKLDTLCVEVAALKEKSSMPDQKRTGAKAEKKATVPKVDFLAGESVKPKKMTIALDMLIYAEHNSS